MYVTHLLGRIKVLARFDASNCLQASLSWASLYHFNFTLNARKSLY